MKGNASRSKRAARSASDSVATSTSSAGPVESRRDSSSAARSSEDWLIDAKPPRAAGGSSSAITVGERDGGAAHSRSGSLPGDLPHQPLQRGLDHDLHGLGLADRRPLGHPQAVVGAGDDREVDVLEIGRELLGTAHGVVLALHQQGGYAGTG